MENKIPAFLLEKSPVGSFSRGNGNLKTPFIEKGIHHLADVIRTGYIQWETATRDNFFQGIDARIKLLFLSFYIIIVSVKKEILPEALIGVFIFTLVLISRLNILSFYKRVLFFGFFFGFLVALPSAFNIFTKGEIIVPVLHLSKDYRLWIYQIPGEIGLTREGIYGVVILTSRVMNSLALSFFVLYTTPFPEIVKALKAFRVPDSALMIISLSYKYTFLFAKTAEDMHLAKKSRTAGQVRGAADRRWVAGRIASIFRKTQVRCEEIFKAMLGRGFSGEISVHGLRNLDTRDLVTGFVFLLIGTLFIWM